MSKSFEDIVGSLVGLEDDKTLKLVKEKLAAGEVPRDILAGLASGMNIVGAKYGTREYYLAELIMAAEIFKGAMNLIRPYLGAEGGEACGKIVIGTVEGDLHDIGKNIFIALAENAGFKLYDLGVDVPPARLVEAVINEKAEVLGMSSILTLSLDPMKKTIELLEEKGVRDQVKVIIGGLPVDEMWRRQVGADAATDDAYEGLQMVKSFMGVE